MTNAGNQSEAERLRAKALARWEGEGGGLGHSAPSADTLDDMELKILARLGAALLGQWNELPAELQGTLFTRTSTPYTSAERAHLKSELARFLDHHKNR